ncbi:hypothetical protein M378DRAFT_427319 [Amanita muscaria Koide BX008]|uniref:Uncharacterized protein n=1 Tax=Amanita muscaria (strain Koide BX008) TaxID=946122 RepID=A0A0C2SRZ0_AMAMK|nr:hypothetical protein M378DRAFT_427319 [Amanita muscaria Koide BX008]
MHSDDPLAWLEGPCTISRSPIAYPADIQRVLVTAIGKPPEDKLCQERSSGIAFSWFGCMDDADLLANICLKAYA